MRWNRRTAATAAAVLALGSTIATASGDDTADQTVTIEVTALARSITIGAPASTLSVAGGTAGSDSTTSSLSYSNGSEREMDITAQLNGVTTEVGGATASEWTALGDLTLAVSVSGLPTSSGTNTGDGWSNGSFLINSLTQPVGADGPSFRRIVCDISTDRSVTGKEVVYTLGGTAPATVMSATVEVRLTLTNDDC